MLYLKDEIADFFLLQFPFNSQFDYPTLLQVCHELQGQAEISFQSWQSIAQTHFLFSIDQTELYFETFSLLFSRKVDQFLKPIPTVAFILFLYNQLFNQSGMAGSRIDSEFPNLKEEPHDPLGSLIYPTFSSRMSIASLEDLDFEDVKTDINDEEQLRLLEGDCQRLYKPLCNVRTEGRTKKEYREDNKEYLKEYQKKYRIDNKERKKAYHIINYSNNSEKYIKKAKLYRDTNKDSISLNKKKYYQENKEEINRKNRERRAKKKLEKLAVIQE